MPEKKPDKKTREYLEGFLSSVKNILDADLFGKLHNYARSYAGGKGKVRDDEPTFFEKLSLKDMRPTILREVPDGEIRNAWLKLIQWYGQAKKRGRAVEDFVNAGVFVLAEMDSRKIDINRNLDFFKVVEGFTENFKSMSVLKNIRNLPKDIMVVSDFVQIVGSSISQSAKDSDDIDVLFRAKNDGNNYLIQDDNVCVPIRKILDPDKKDFLHYIDSPQGSHGDCISLYDLVLRRKADMTVRLMKEDAMPGKGSKGAKVAFVGSSPGLDETEAGEPFVTDNEELLDDLYVKPLGLTMKDIFKTNAVPIFLQDKAGRIREPNIDEIIDWNEHLISELGKIKPKMIIALGPQAEDALGDFADFNLPHPNFVKKFGVPKKLGATMQKIKSAMEFNIRKEKETIRLDIGCGSKDERPDGYIGIDIASECYPDIVHDLEKGIPYGDNSVDVIRAHHSLEHIADKEKAMSEIHRVLKAGASLEFEVPSTRGDDDTSYSDHKSHWNKTAFSFWTEDHLLGNRPRFEVDKIEEIESDKVVQVRGVLRKPKTYKSAELKVMVLDKQTTKSGDFNYSGGLLPGEGQQFKNIKELRGKEYINLSKSFSTNVDAEIGDIITVETLQINPDETKKQLTWFGAKVIDIDKTRGRPFNADEVVDIAKSKGILKTRVRSQVKITPDVQVMLMGMGYNLVEKQKGVGEEGGETRGETAEKQWGETWGTRLPKSGKGKFVYQHHYRGLDEEEAKLPESKLLNTDHSLHGDIRLEGSEDLWGFSAFIGNPGDNKKAGGDKLIVVKPDDAIQGGFKLQQPKQWIGVGAGKGDVFGPGEPGATSQKSAKFFIIDSGNYEIGVAKLHFYEIFFKGDKLKERYIIQSVPREGKRIWQITKPSDQTPFAEREDLADQIRDQQKKNRKWIYWNMPGSKPKLIDLKKVKPEDFEVEKGLEFELTDKEDPGPDRHIVKIAKTDKKLNLFYSVIMPRDEFDSHGDNASREEVRKAAHAWFLKKTKPIWLRHKGKAKIEMVESYLAPVDFPMGGEKIFEGDWVGGWHVLDNKLMKKIEDKKYNAVSIGAYAKRQKII